MKTLTGGTHTAFLAFFASHIPATLCIDLQAFAGDFYPQILKDVLSWYCDLVNDDLMRAPYDTWFKAVIVGEMFLQLPFFFVAVYVLLHADRFSKGNAGRGWFRSSCMIYGAHTATTLLPILACHCANTNATSMEKFMVVSIYLPYLIFPLWLIYICCVSENILAQHADGKVKNG